MKAPTEILKCCAALVVFALTVSGCAHYPANAPLKTIDTHSGYRFPNAVAQTNSDGLLLALAFSGGGARAAALSYGVLDELRKTEVGCPGNEHRLLDDVEMISSVSGGSFTAACYSLWGDRIFSDFEPQFLKKRVQTGLLLHTLAPWNLGRLASPKFSSSDLAAEYYDHLLFQGATFRDLAPRPGRPFLIVNATDLGIGARFEFTQDQFDLIHSDLSQFPIARAVAASCAFPLFFGPVILRNHSADQATPEPEWIQSALSNPAASSRLKSVALQAHSYVDGDRRKFIHLVDGGIADNLGLRGPAERAIKLEEGDLTSAPTLKLPRRLAVIIVDANTDRDYGWDSKDRTLGVGALLSSVGQVILSRDSFETIELFREVSARLVREHEKSGVKFSGSSATEIVFYIVELHFTQLADPADRRFFNSVPTRLQLPASTVDRLETIAATELKNNPEFQSLVADLRRPPALAASQSEQSARIRPVGSERSESIIRAF